MTNLKQSILHGLLVLAHIMFSVGVVALGILIVDPKVEEAFSQGLVHYGIPVTIANIIIAAIIKSINLNSQVQQPPQTPQQ